MGLDMYLTKKTYVKNWDYMSAQQKTNVVVQKKDEQGKTIPHPTIKPERISNIEEEILYWRKANHIHNWFVENVQQGEDDCEEYGVGTDQLKELLTVCKRILEDNSLAEDLLPTTSGFFFGGTDYDEYYFEELKKTVEILEEEEKEGWSGDYYYQSSW